MLYPHSCPRVQDKPVNGLLCSYLLDVGQKDKGVAFLGHPHSHFDPDVGVSRVLLCNAYK